MDLDIHNYTPVELRTFFNMKPGHSHTAADIELRAYEIRERLVSGKHIPKGQMRQFITFMTAASAALVAASTALTADTGIQKQSHNQIHTILPATPYVAPNEFYVKTQTQMVSIDTRFRENAYTTSASNFAISLPTKLSKVVTIEVASFDMAIDATSTVYQAMRNNFFVLRILLNPGNSVNQLEHTVTVPDGHYATADELVYAVRESIYAATVSAFRPTDNRECCLSGQSELFGTIELTLDERTGRVNLYTEHPDIQSLELDFSLDEEGDSDRRQVEYYTKLGRVLGFTRRKYRGQKEYGGETRVDPFLCVRYFYLEIADFQNQYAPTFVPAFSNMNLSPSVIAKVVRDHDQKQNDLRLITEPRVYFGPTDVSRIQVRILDAYGNVMDLANVDYSFTLRVRYMYDSALIKL